MIEDGLNDAVAPLGAPLAVNTTVWAAPLVTAVLIVLVADWPDVAVREPGEALTEKSSVVAVHDRLTCVLDAVAVRFPGGDGGVVSPAQLICSCGAWLVVPDSFEQ